MNVARDLHAAPKTDQVSSSRLGGIQVALVRLQWTKDDIRHSIHVSPNSFTMSGIQMTDILALVGLSRTSCPFFHGSGYCGWVGEDFDCKSFADAVVGSLEDLKLAAKHFEACGVMLPQPEGWGHFYGSGPRAPSTRPVVRGDGHTSPVGQHMKFAEDENFLYAFSWIDGRGDKGWTTHYRPKIGGPTAEVDAVFTLLGMRSFASCPQFDFDPCHWLFRPHNEVDFMCANHARERFDAHVTQFSPGVERLLRAHSRLLPFGMRLLKVPVEAQKSEMGRRFAPSRGSAEGHSKCPDLFDVAISFAGVDRPLAEKLANAIRAAGYSVFYDSFYPAELWGKDLVVLFDDIYRKRARHCVMLISREYADREWTNHERRSAQAREIKERGNDYILPIKVDDVELPGMPPTIGYLALSQFSIESISEILIEKLRKSSS